MEAITDIFADHGEEAARFRRIASFAVDLLNPFEIKS